MNTSYNFKISLFSHQRKYFPENTTILPNKVHTHQFIESTNILKRAKKLDASKETGAELQSKIPGKTM